MKNITLIIPAKEESESLPTVLYELQNFDYKITIILKDDDVKTIESIKKFNCEIIYQNGKGYGDALISGIKSTSTEYVCVFNADGSFNPNEISVMQKKLNEDNSDFIFASRYDKDAKSDDDTLLTIIGNRIFTNICKILFGTKINDILYTFVLSKTKCIKDLNLRQKDFKFCIELPYKANKLGFKISSISSHERIRIAGRKKVNEFRDGLKILIYIIKIFLTGGRNKN